MSDSTTLAPRPRRRLSRIPRSQGETREMILDHAEAGGRLAARLVRVETGGVDRTTGRSLRVYFEVTVKCPGTPEATRLFAGQGDPVAAEWNARVAYLMAQHGTVEFSTWLGDLPPRQWSELKNLAALAVLGDPRPLARTRINSGDSDADSASGRGAAPKTCPLRPEARFAVPAWAGSEVPVWPVPAPGTDPLFREVSEAELRAEEAVVLALAPPEEPAPRRVYPGMHGLPACRCRRGCCATCTPRLAPMIGSRP